MSACLTRGTECLVGAPAEERACCTRGATLCHDLLERIADDEARFVKRLTKQGCADLPLADLLAADGLGYGTLASRCGIPNLRELAACLADEVVRTTTCSIVTTELPRSAEAIVCLGNAPQFLDTTGVALGSDACAPRPPGPTPGAMPTPLSTPGPICEPGATVDAAVSISRAVGGISLRL